jgi:hypothetical protein
VRIKAEAVEFACDRRVPDRVEVCALGFVAVEDYRDVVAAARQVFGVEGLVDVADEVQDEFQGFVASAEGVGGVEEEGSLLI